MNRQDAIINGVKYAAALSDCGRFRYWLRRQWDDDVAEGGSPVVTWIMLNPSKADGTRDDPTIRRCMGFARRWGFGGIDVRNLYPWRSTEPSELKAAHKQRKPVTGGSEGEMALRVVAQGLTEAERGPVVVAWGEQGVLSERGVVVCRMYFREVPLWCLDVTLNGHPRHPLYVPSKNCLMPYNSTAAAVPANRRPGVSPGSQEGGAGDAAKPKR